VSGYDSLRYWWRKLQVPRPPPDFLSGLVVSVDFMRLSPRKAAYVVVDESSVVGNPEFAPNDTGGGGPSFSAAPTALRSYSGSIPSPSGLGSRLVPALRDRRDDKGWGGASMGIWLVDESQRGRAVGHPSFVRGSDKLKALFNQMFGVDHWVGVRVGLHRIIASIS
jgi:hypothetical protein